MQQEPIDAVITWVDGSDPKHAKKLEDYLQSIGGSRPKSASKTRFHHAGELDYCVTSILKFAPWIRTIFIVTDDQQPELMKTVKGTEFESRIRVIDHQTIFQGYEQHLPTFNSSSILGMLWRIPEVAEKFIFFNDDFFLIAPVKPEDFFRDDKVVTRGKWRLLTRKISDIVNKQNKKNQRAGFWAGQQLTAMNVGFKWRYFRLPHVPHAWRVSTQRIFFEKNPDLLNFNIGFRLRSAQQMIGESLAIHLEFVNNDVVVDKSLINVQLKPKEQSLWRIKWKLWCANRNPNAVFACVQSIESASPEKQKLIFDWLNKRVGNISQFLNVFTT